MDLNIALLPDYQTSERLIKLSETITRSLTNELQLNQRDALPHITVYLARFPEPCLIELHDRISSICSNSQALRIQASGGRISASGTVMVDCNGPPELRLFNQQMTSAVSGLHEGVADVWARNAQYFTETEFRLLKDNGYPYGLKVWHPHFTVAKIDPSRFFKIESILDQFCIEFRAAKVGLCRSDEKGLVKEILYSFTLLG